MFFDKILTVLFSAIHPFDLTLLHAFHFLATQRLTSPQEEELLEGERILKQNEEKKEKVISQIRGENHLWSILSFVILLRQLLGEVHDFPSI